MMRAFSYTAEENELTLMKSMSIYKVFFFWSVTCLHKDFAEAKIKKKIL